MEKCFICSENIREACMLPCSHSFCLECLTEKFGYRENNDDEPHCPHCGLFFEIPEGGLTILKKTDPVEENQNVDENRIRSCGICLKSDAEKLCVNCDIQFCVSCILVHEKLPLTKDHRIIKISPSRYTNSLAGYCETCKKLLYLNANDDGLNHDSCTVINISEYKQTLQKHLLQIITEAGKSAVVIRKHLNFIDEEKLTATADANLLKKKIRYQSEQLQSYVWRFIEECTCELNERVDEECKRFKNKLGWSKNELLNLETTLQDRISRCKTFLNDFNRKIVMQAFEGDLVTMFELNKNISKKMTEKLLTTPFNEGLRLSFEPTKQNKLFRGPNFVGTLNRVRKPHPELIRVITGFDASTSLSVDGLMLHGFNFEFNHPNFNNMTSVSISRLCNKTYNQMLAATIDVNYYHAQSAILVGRFLCMLCSSHLLIYDPDIRKDRPGWVKNIPFSFNGSSLRSSDMSIFIIHHTDVTEMSLEGDKVCEIRLPQNLEMLSNILKLSPDRYAVMGCNDVQVINSNGDVFKTLSDSISPEQFKAQSRMTSDNNGNIFISDGNSEIFVLDYDLNVLQQFDAKCSLTQICYDSRRDRLLVFGEKQLNVFQL